MRPAPDIIRAPCPECDFETRIGHDELGEPLLCPQCRTEYVILREKRRQRVPRTASLTRIHDPEDGTSVRVDPTSSRGLGMVIRALFLAFIFLLVALNFSRITDAVKSALAWLASPPTAEEIPPDSLGPK